MTSHPEICAVILAGGRAQRMGGTDKGLIQLNNRPLISHVLERITPQVGSVIISANRNIEEYRQFGYPVLTDITPDFNGPLAGLSRAMAESILPLMLCVPCDTPQLPTNLVSLLLQQLDKNNAEIAIATDGKQVHRAVFLCRQSLLPALDNFLKRGGRRVGEWQSTLKHVEVSFNDEMAFLNLNTPDELALLNAQP